ncbi:hypothetical protein LCGC14_2195720 [marine sediment metagenome]|uniref:Uncharacterized protein n=1 Tax=marine sediment metagenome TaxID=412755 RepID=A0A0F9GE17_9ZZZZ
MPEGDMLKDMEFENELTQMGDDQPKLIKFVARQQLFVIGRGDLALRQQSRSVVQFSADLARMPTYAADATVLGANSERRTGNPRIRSGSPSTTLSCSR